MNNECEVCGNTITVDNKRIIALIDYDTKELLEELVLCNNCRDHYEFTIGVVDTWEDLQ